jgi:hypothetical protein
LEFNLFLIKENHNLIIVMLRWSLANHLLVNFNL